MTFLIAYVHRLFGFNLDSSRHGNRAEASHHALRLMRVPHAWSRRLIYRSRHAIDASEAGCSRIAEDEAVSMLLALRRPWSPVVMLPRAPYVEIGTWKRHACVVPVLSACPRVEDWKCMKPRVAPFRTPPLMIRSVGEFFKGICRASTSRLPSKPKKNHASWRSSARPSPFLTKLIATKKMS
jgi:hypothetical protein